MNEGRRLSSDEMARGYGRSAATIAKELMKYRQGPYSLKPEQLDDFHLWWDTWIGPELQAIANKATPKAKP